MSNEDHASNMENLDTEDEDNNPLRASDIKELSNPARPLYQNAPDLDETMISEEDSEEEDYHTDYSSIHKPEEKFHLDDSRIVWILWFLSLFKTVPRIADYSST